MSRQIDPERIESGDLTTDEVLYLQDRQLLPDDITPLILKYNEGGTFVDPEEDDEPEANSDDEAEDYGKGWNNQTRRTTLAERGLSVDGKAEALIDRLIRSDKDELLEDDYPVKDDEGEDEGEDSTEESEDNEE